MAQTFHRPVSTDGPVFVKDVTPCRAFDMYGYSVGWKCFLKIRLFNPVHIYKCADLVLSGAVTGEPLQPYESHIPYILSFLADYDLYGCGWLHIDESKCIERVGRNRTAYEGQEYDLDVTSILNKQSFEHDQRHTQIFETQSNAISISSLQESREADANWRQQIGLKPWEPMNLQPYYQELSHQWTWERSEEYKDHLSRQIEENKATGDSWPVIDIELLPTAGELVPTASSPIKSQNRTSGNKEESKAAVSENIEEQGEIVMSESEDEVIYSQPDSDEELLQMVQATSKKNIGQVAARKTASVLELGAIADAPLRQNVDQEAAGGVRPDLDSQFISSPDANHSRITAEKFGMEGHTVLQFRYQSPPSSDVLRTKGITEYTPPHYSKPEDVSSNPFKYGDKEMWLKTLNPEDLPAFSITLEPSYPPLQAYMISANNDNNNNTSVGFKKRCVRENATSLEFTMEAPTTIEVQEWLTSERQATQLSLSSASGRYQFGSLGTRESVNEELKTCVIEVHAQTRPSKVPKASIDPIHSVFWHVSGEYRKNTTTTTTTPDHGIITLREIDASETASVVVVSSEQELLEEVIKMVRYFNPDILTGYETNAASWGYARVRFRELHKNHLDTFYEELGRVMPHHVPGWKSLAAGNAATSHTPAAPLGSGEEGLIKGRHLLSFWNIVRRELSLSKYTLEHVVFHVLHETTPHYSYDDLNAWWLSGDPTAMGTVVRYWSHRVQYVLRLLEHFELVNRTCERSRITGVDFLSSLTRGSQFQVEAVLCRLSRRQNFLLMSPSKSQVGQQNALEHIPLVMEPLSDFYTDPVCVLDFRSLYPSVVIALNLCYSTCIGRLNPWRGHNKIGVKENHRLQQGILAKIGEENIYVAPNGIGYVSPKVRKSLLAQMLGEILDTRFMTNETRKAKMPNGEENSRRQHNLNNKQLALKFIANVTYGYTSASFSGRMPCAELADSIVLAGREILQWSIKQIESVQKWGVQPHVVYGDTDSLFVRLPGVSKEQGFRIGSEIADMITSQTPDPILLKLEKVYQPCILLTKKRYVGHAYERPTQIQPIFDAKGTETVRRDGTPIVQKIERRALEILFKSSDLSKVKSYLQNQWRTILRGHNLNVPDFCFAQEVKLGHYKTSNSTSNLPGGAVVSLKRMLKDDGAEPQYKERVPFVVTAGPAGSKINDRVVSPEEMIKSPNLMIDGDYYIQRVIMPPLERLLNLVGANVKDWYLNMPRPMRTSRITMPKSNSSNSSSNIGSHSSTLYGFLQTEMCAVCLDKRRESSSSVLCSDCQANQPRSRYILTYRTHAEEKKLSDASAKCRLCSGPFPPITIGSGYRTHPCQSIDCPVYYDREAAYNELHASLELVNALL